MKIYLAGSCSSEQRTMMVRVADFLREYDNTEVFCPFELKIPNAWDMSQEAWAQKVFDEDTRAIREADIVILITPGRESTAGTNWEQGFAYALGKPVYVFQITNKSTSLMTYCGCELFFNVLDERELMNAIHYVMCDDSYVDKNPCKTILT